MDIISALAGPAVGAAIGYITNDIAIRMLFRPHKAVYVLGHRLPFTPGIVPRRKDQLAKILGDAIVAKFFNADDLEIIFTDGIADAVADSVMELLDSGAKPSRLLDALPAEAVEHLETELCIRIQAAFCTSDMPRLLAEKGVEMVSGALVSERVGQALANNIAGSKTDAITGGIKEFVISHGHEYILPLIAKELERASDIPLCDFTSRLPEEKRGRLRETIRSLYLRFMSAHVRSIVETIDVGGMITEKIVLMTSMEVEDLVLTVVRRELRMVVLFGAFIGALIGAVNSFI